MTEAIALRVRPPAIYERPKLPHEAALISAAGAKRANPGQAARHRSARTSKATRIEVSTSEATRLKDGPAKPLELKCGRAKPLALTVDQQSHILTDRRCYAWLRTMPRVQLSGRATTAEGLSRYTAAWARVRVRVTVAADGLRRYTAARTAITPD